MGMPGLESFHHPGKNLVLGIKVKHKKDLLQNCICSRSIWLPLLDSNQRLPD